MTYFVFWSCYILFDIILYILDIIYKSVRPNSLFPKKIDHILAALAKWVTAALGAPCDPKCRTDAGHCPRVRTPTQTEMA
jgi:hypothetical protein